MSPTRYGHQLNSPFRDEQISYKEVQDYISKLDHIVSAKKPKSKSRRTLVRNEEESQVTPKATFAPGAKFNLSKSGRIVNQQYLDTVAA